MGVKLRMPPKSEASVENYYVRQVKKLGGVSFKLTFVSKRGAFDRLSLLPGEVFFVELKRRKGKLSDHQKELRDLFRSYGVDTYTLYTKEEVDAFIDQIS